MGLPTARMLDNGVGIDDCHSTPKTGTGFIIDGSATVFTNGLPTAKMLSTVLFPDGHTGIIIQGSATVFTNGLPTARMLDQFVGCFTGILIEGSSNVFTG
jgi:uncharacterized Zn-binding protein involved in type VI secretion